MPVPRSPRHAAFAVLLGSALVFALPAHTAPTPDPAQIAAAERDFAVSVRRLGVRDGFLAWLAPTSVVFKPGPVMGVAHHQKLASGWNGLLDWHPVRAGISADGRLGWSTGPWTWRRDSTQRSADAHGEYMSVWRQQANGTWRVVLDGGIGHPAPSGPEPALTFVGPAPGSRLGSRPLAARKSLYEADASYARTAAVEGIAGALRRFASEDVVVLRDGSPRYVGRSIALPALAVTTTRAELVSNAQFIADSGDLGYTYGSLVAGPAAAPDTSWYVHVWQRGAATPWQLAAELVMPVPKRKSP
jgi:ketosteroid isomerase-like protein